ncbi:M23 family metallopeptidase [Anaerosporobacter faecicola]|uniref:M23 family metallopeptidase n=1 Tax=Anaerosporobacter faecicola TaxID=2718714 RepID=UPI00143C589D|nr:M23 family metallopeptidase [Anaerosporobacter faecicola]
MKKKNVPDFLKAKGFYISLLTGICALCVICIVYVSMLTSNNKDNLVDLNDSTAKTEDMVSDDNKVATDEGTQEQNVAGIDADVPMDLTGDAEIHEEAQETTSNAVATEGTAEEEQPETVATSGKGTNLTFNEEEGLLWPVDGNVIMNYSMNSVIYFQTLDQYKCNPAIIIQAEVGDEVLNAADGVVTDISYNEETGNTVTVSLGDGYEVVYGQLDENLNITKGQTVKEGAVIGKVAEPTKYYIKEGTNLFFEVLLEENTVNPMLLLR